MHAIIMLDDGGVTNNNLPADASAREAANSLISMGIGVIYHKSFTANPTSVAEMEDVISKTGAIAVIQPTQLSSNRDAFQHISVNGLSKPVFILGINHSFTGRLKGVSSFYAGDTGGTAAQMEIVNSEDKRIPLYSIAKRFSLETYSAPEDSIAIATGLSKNGEADAVVAWKYTPDGEKWIYMENLGSSTNTLHMLMQEAINDGQLERPPIAAATILTIDHFANGDGSGTVLQPEIIPFLGDILRSVNGICYASFEWNKFQFMTATQIANFIEYSDVFKYVPTHDHDSSGTYTTNGGYTKGTAANDSISNQESKIDIDASFQATKAALESIGLTANLDFAHFAQNRVGDNFWQLATPETNVLADPLELVAQAGYGFKGFRAGAFVDNSDTYPPSASNEIHWMAQKTVIRGIRSFGPSRDGDSENGAIIDLTKDYTAFRQTTQAFTKAVMTYFHEVDFEEPPVTEAVAQTRGRLAYQTGAAYAKFCKDTVNFGANIVDYL